MLNAAGEGAVAIRLCVRLQVASAREYGVPDRMIACPMSTPHLSPGVGVAPHRLRQRKPQELALEGQPCQRRRSRESLRSSVRIVCRREGRTADVDEHRRHVVDMPLTNRWLRREHGRMRVSGARVEASLSLVAKLSVSQE